MYHPNCQNQFLINIELLHIKRLNPARLFNDLAALFRVDGALRDLIVLLQQNVVQTAPGTARKGGTRPPKTHPACHILDLHQLGHFPNPASSPLLSSPLM